MSGGNGYERFLDDARKRRSRLLWNTKNTSLTVGRTLALSAKAICKDTELVVLDNGGFTQPFITYSPITPEEFITVDSDEHMYAARYPYYAVCDGRKETAFVPRGDMNIGRYFGFLFMEKRSINTFELLLSLETMSFDFSMFDLELRGIQGVWNTARMVSQSHHLIEGNNT